LGSGVWATTIKLQSSVNVKMIYGNPIEDSFISSLTLDGNKGGGNTGAGTYGIHFESPKRVHIDDVVIVSTGSSAVYLTGTPVDCTVSDVYVDDAGQFESIVALAGTEIARCTVRRPTGKGIMVGAQSAVRDCHLVAPASNVTGIHVQGSHCFVEGNRLDWTSATGGTGITCKTACDDVVITGNHYFGNPATSGTERAGIHVGTGAVGPAVPNNKRCVVTSNVIVDGTSDGILLGVGTSDTGSDCVIADNVVASIRLSGQPGDLGVGIETHYDRTNLSGNVVKGCSGHGFFIEGLYNSVTDNISEGNGTVVTDAAGIKIISSSAVCRGNVCVDNGSTGTATAGVLVAPDAGAVSDIAITDNLCTDTRASGAKTQDYGIAFTGAAGSVTRTTIDGNLIEGNGAGPLLTTSLASASVGRNSPSAITAVTAAYTASVLDEVVLANPGAGAIAVTLPSAARIAGFQIVVKRTGASLNAVTVVPTGAETIDGGGTISLGSATFPARYATLVSDGANWETI
jgi:hypothetical protein